MSILTTIDLALYAITILMFWKRIKYSSINSSASSILAANQGDTDYSSDGTSVDNVVTQNRHLLFGLIFAATFFHGMILFPEAIRPPNLNLALGNVFSLVSLMTVTVFMIGSLARRILNLGILVMPVGMTGMVTGVFFSGQPLIISNVPMALWLHLVIALLAFSILCIAAAQALLLYVQEIQLHRPNPGALFPALPAIQTMEANLFQLTWIGAILLTVNLITGMLSSWQVHGQTLTFNHHILLSFIAWMGFSALLLGHKIYGWRGKIAAKWTMIAFGVLILAYFGSRFVNSIILS